MMKPLGPVALFKSEYRRRQFLDYVHHRGGDLDLIVDILIAVERRGRTRSELQQAVQISRWGDGQPLSERVQISRPLSFLAGQQLLYQLHNKRGGSAVYKAVPRALDGTGAPARTRGRALASGLLRRRCAAASSRPAQGRRGIA